MKDRFLDTGRQIIKSDWCNLGFVGEIKKISMEKNRSLISKVWNVGWRVGTTLGLASCAVNTAVQPTTSSEPSGNNSNNEAPFGLLPNNETLNNGIYQTESYCSDNLAICVFHQFDQDGKALAPRIFTNSKINFDLDNNRVIVTGNSLVHADNEVVIYPEHDGQKGYETLQVMSVEDATAWMENMSEESRGNMQVVIDEAKSNSVDVRILVKTVLNVQKDNSGQDKLVNMIAGLAITSGEEGAAIIQLNDTLEPLTENALLKDQQIAAVDFVPQFDESENLVMEVYPSNWQEIGNGQYVSPEFIALQDQIAASGEKFTLTSNGIIQEKNTDGVRNIEGLFIDKKGQITLLVNGEKVIIEPSALIINDEKGITINGYVFDVKTGLWTLESQLPAEMVSGAQEFFGEGFEITPQGKVIDKDLDKEIQGLTIVPFDEQTMIPPYKKEVTWGWQRVYEFEGKTDFTVVGTEADITVTENNGLDMYAWGYENGEFTRQKVEFAAPNNGIVKIEGFSPQEVQYMIMTNSSTDPKFRAYGHETLRQMAIKYIPKTVANRDIYYTYKGMWELADRNYQYYGNNFIPISNSSGTWSTAETTTFMVYPEFKDRSKALVVWMDQNNKPVVVVMEGKYLEMPQYFNPYWQNHDIADPFNP